jgi:hypothetical protein
MISRSQFELPSASVPPSVALASAPTRIRSSRSFFVPTTPSFSIPSALFSKHPHLIEKKEKSPFSKSNIFNQFRTLSHSFPGSPLLSVCSPKHTGGIPPSLLGRRLTSGLAQPIRAPHLQTSPRGAKQLSPGREPGVSVGTEREPQRGDTSFDLELRPQSRVDSRPAPDFPRVDHLGTARQSCDRRAFRRTTKSRRMDSYRSCDPGARRRSVGGRKCRSGRKRYS